MNELRDDSLMPFGKYKGKEMQDVPARYLLWLYENNPNLSLNVKRYVIENMDVLKKEINEGS